MAYGQSSLDAADASCRPTATLQRADGNRPPCPRRSRTIRRDLRWAVRPCSSIRPAPSRRDQAWRDALEAMKPTKSPCPGMIPSALAWPAMGRLRAAIDHRLCAQKTGLAVTTPDKKSSRSATVRRPIRRTPDRRRRWRVPTTAWPRLMINAGGRVEKLIGPHRGSAYGEHQTCSSGTGQGLLASLGVPEPPSPGRSGGSSGENEKAQQGS